MWDQKSTTAITTGSVAPILGFLPGVLYNATRIKPHDLAKITTRMFVISFAFASHVDQFTLPSGKLFRLPSLLQSPVVQFFPSSPRTGTTKMLPLRRGFMAAILAACLNVAAAQPQEDEGSFDAAGFWVYMLIVHL